MHRLAAKIKAGTVWGNCHAVIDPALPFGGYSNRARPRQGRQGVEPTPNSKTVINRALGVEARRPPMPLSGRPPTY